jgi:hypothetical protein
LALVLGYFAPLATGDIPWVPDVALYFLPFKVAGAELWRHGQVPLWTPLAGLGYPLLADGQAALLYLPDVLLFLLLPPATAFNLSVVGHTLLGSSLAFAFLRRQGLRAPAAFLGSAVFTFAGPLVPLAGTPRMSVAAWWPALLLAIDGLALASSREPSRIPSRRWIVGGAVAVAMMLLAGFPQVAAIGLALAVVYALFRSRQSYRVIGWTAVILGLGIGLAAPQWLATLELAGQSARAGGAGALAKPGSLFPPATIEIVAPSLRDLATLGDESPSAAVGIVALVLAGMAVATRRTSAHFWAGVALVGLALAMGRFTPLFWLTTHAPGFAYFRVPARFLYLTTTALAVLAAHGFDEILRSTNVERRARWLLAVGLALGGTAVATLLVVGIALRLAQGRVYAMVSHLPGIATTIGQPATSRLVTEAYAATDPTNPRVWVPVLGALGVALVALALRRRRRYLASVTIAFCLTELAAGGYPIGKVGSFSSTSAMAQTVVAADCPHGPYDRLPNGLAGSAATRIYSLVAPYTAATDGRYDLLPPNLPTLHGIGSVGLYAALGDPTYADLLDPLGTVDLAFGEHHPTASAVAAHRRLLDLLGARVIVSPEPLGSFDLVERVGLAYLYRNPSAFPRVWVATAAWPIQGDLRSSLESSDLQHIALLDGIGAIPRISAAGRTPTAALLEDDGTRVAIAATGPGILVLDDRWAPGWDATVDGAPTPVLRVDGILRGVLLSPGDHQVIFNYRPAGLWWGSLMALLAAVVLIILVGAFSIPRPTGR